MPSTSQYASIVLVLAIANTLACATAFYPPMQQLLHAEKYRHHTAAYWSIILNFFGVGLGLMWPLLANLVGYRLTLAASSLLLCLFTLLNSLITFPLFNLFCGLFGSTPLYLAPQMFASNSVPVRPGAALLTFSVFGGLVVGPIVGMLVTPLPLVFSSLFLGFSLFFAIDPSAPFAEHTAEPAKGSKVQQESSAKRLDVFALFGACEGAVLGCFCSIIFNFYLRNCIGRWSLWHQLEPFLGTLVGIIAGSAISSRSKSGDSSYITAPRFLTGVIAWMAQSTLAYHLYQLEKNYLHARQGYRFHVLLGAGIVWGGCLSSQFATSMAIRSELWSNYTSGLNSACLSAKYLTCSIVMVLVWCINNDTSRASLYVLFGGFPAILAWISCRIYVTRAYLSRKSSDIETGDDTASLRMQIETLENRLKVVNGGG